MEKNVTELKFNIGDVIEYIGPRKELAPGQYVIRDINNDCYITNRNNIPIKFQEYYRLVSDSDEVDTTELNALAYLEQLGYICLPPEYKTYTATCIGAPGENKALYTFKTTDVPSYFGKKLNIIIVKNELYDN